MLQLNKKGVSLIVSYVLLISIGLSIAGIVYGWLKFYVNIDEGIICPDGISTNIIDSSYYQEDVFSGNIELNLTIQNRGRFNIEGYVVRVNDREGATTGKTLIYMTGDPSSPLPHFERGGDFPLIPGEIGYHQFNQSYLNSKNLSRICFVEIQPLIKQDNGEIVWCDQRSTRRIACKTN